jgi:hypothetical protein
MARRFLEIYLADHHAGSVAGVELAKRMARSNRGTPMGQALDRLVGEIEADRVTLENVLAAAGVQLSFFKDRLAWTLEKADRLKPNGLLRGSSALGRLHELEALSLGVWGKRALWLTLGKLREPARPPSFDFDALAKRAEAQFREIEELRIAAAAQAFADDPQGCSTGASSHDDSGTNAAVGPGLTKLLRMSVRVQSGYYVATGVWPLLNRRSFEAITGRKVDFWLAQAVGVTVTAIGVGLAFSARRDGPSDDMRATALLAALGLGMIDVVFVARRVISPVYLLDAVAEAVFVGGVASRRTFSRPSPRP